MRLNRIRSVASDPFISHMRIAYDEGIRKETEDYWRQTLVSEILERIESIPKDDGGYCHTLHYCDVVEMIDLSKGKR